MIRSGGISYDADSVSSSAALLSVIDNAGQAASRIAQGVSTLNNNISFNDTFVNGVTLLDAASSPQNDMNGLGKTAAQLTDQSSYAGLGWNFNGVWKMGPPAYPYPVLQWQTGTPPVPSGFALLTNGEFGAEFHPTLDEPISLTATAQTIYKNSNPKTLTIAAPEGYDAYRWLVGGKTAGTAQSISVNAANYATGDHAVTAIVCRGTVPYSKNIIITVSGE
jgi:hypothetical protein